ncbi:MAG: TlpA family protein disulfide reductase [Betaproteobacteria bacterium]
MRRWLLFFFVAGGLLLAGRAGAQPAPPFELEDLEGETHRLADYRGKVVLVNFWATWCAPCREEMPGLQRLRQALAGKPFVVLAVNVAEGRRVAANFMEGMPYGFTVLLDGDGSTTKAWGARILPATFVLGPEGEVRIRHFGILDWSSAEAQRRIAGLLP